MFPFRWQISSSPSGRHVGHYLTIARMESDVMRATLCLIAEAAIQSQRPLDRWLHCTQVMLDKGKGNHISNLRIIQLLEADLNFALRLIWGKRFNRAAHGHRDITIQHNTRIRDHFVIVQCYRRYSSRIC